MLLVVIVVSWAHNQSECTVSMVYVFVALFTFHLTYRFVAPPGEVVAHTF